MVCAPLNVFVSFHTLCISCIYVLIALKQTNMYSIINGVVTTVEDGRDYDFK